MDGEKLKPVSEVNALKTDRLKVVLNQIIEARGLDYVLKTKGKSCYKFYELGEIEDILLDSYKEEWPSIIKAHLLSKSPYELGGNVFAIFLIGHVTQTYGSGREIFFKAIKEIGITTKESLIKEIWKVGRCDGQYLGILNADGTVRDLNFFQQWSNSSFII